MRLAGVLLLIACLVASPLPGSTQNSETFECQGGTNAAVLNACGARWEASNIRAHVAGGQYGGATPGCLIKTASLLDEMAAKWLRTNAFSLYKGPWPCGTEPAIAKADDGVLANACPRRVWSYDNRGANDCHLSQPKPVAQHQRVRPIFAPQPAPPTRMRAAGPTPIPTATPFDFNLLSNLMTVDSHRYVWWDGGSVNAGDSHDRSSSSRALFTGCSFRITSQESDVDGRVWSRSWSGNLRDIEPSGIDVEKYASQPASWQMNLTTSGHERLLQHTGTYKNEDGDIEDFQPDDATSVVKLVFTTNPRDTVEDPLRSAIFLCRPN